MISLNVFNRYKLLGAGLKFKPVMYLGHANFGMVFYIAAFNGVRF